MTYEEMYKLWQTLADKAGQPYFSKAQFDQIANTKYNNFVTSECAKLEIDQEHSVRIKELYKPIVKLASNVIIFPTDISDFRYLVRFNARFKKVCGQAITYPPPVPIRKAPNNNVDEMQNDPFNKGIDADPCYVVTTSGGLSAFQVLSETTPVEIGGQYIRQPSAINSATAPDTVFELQNYVAEAIVNAIVFRTDVVIENFQRASAEGAAQQNTEV